MLSSYYRPTTLEVDLDSLEYNLNFFKNKLRKGTEVMAVVKANAYGHGVIPISRYLEKIGVKYFAVAFLDEAIQLRKAGIVRPILVLGYSPEHGVELAIKNDISLTIYKFEDLEKINAVAEKLNKKLKIHIKVDTGMGRIGFHPDDVYKFYQETKKYLWLEVEGIYTHFATSDEIDKTFTNEQYRRFNEIINAGEGLEKIPFKHVSNTAAIIDLPHYSQSIARLGIGLYGLLPSHDVGITFEQLRPVISLKTQVVHIKTVEEGQTVSYGATFKAKRRTVVATLPIGYADGLSRRLSNIGNVLIHGKKALIIGRICMDQTMIDVTDIDDINIGDEVVIIGFQNNEHILIDDHAKILGTINYELATLLGDRIPKVYLKDGKVIEVMNELVK